MRPFRSAHGERRTPRTDVRICQHVVKADSKSPVANEFSGLGNLSNSDCLKVETQEEHTWNFIPRRSEKTIEEAECQIQQELLDPSSTGIRRSDQNRCRQTT